jgi:hypothetical protein
MPTNPGLTATGRFSLITSAAAIPVFAAVPATSPPAGTALCLTRLALADFTLNAALLTRARARARRSHPSHPSHRHPSPHHP